MVKERRAYTTEGVTPTPPTEELRVRDRAVVDLSSTMNAEYNRAGLYLNPQIFDDLAKISDDIHDTRRFSNNWDFMVSETDRELSSRELIDDAQRTIQNTQKAELLERQMMASAEATTAIEEAKNRGENTVPIISALRDRYLKMADSLYNQSPYLGSNFRDFTERHFGALEVQGIKDDYELSSARVQRLVNRDAAVEGALVASSAKSLDAALADYVSLTFPSLDSVPDTRDEELVNKAYNTLVLADAKRVVQAVADPRSGVTRESARNYLNNLRAVYAGNTLVGVDGEGNERRIPVNLTDEVLTSITNSIAKLDENQPKAHSVYAADGYKQMVGVSKASKGEFTNIPYYLNTDPETARRDWENVRAQLITDIGNGNESAVKQLYEIDQVYWTQVHPQIAIISYFKKQLASTGNVDTAIRIVQDRLNSARAKFNSGNMEAINELSWSNGTVMVNIGFPGDDPAFQEYIRRNGETGKIAMYNYYDNLFNNMQLFLNSAKNSDMLAMMNPEFAVASDAVSNFLSNYGNLVREDAATGSIVINQATQAQAIQMVTQAMQTKDAAAGNAIISPTSTRWLSAITATANTKNTKQRAVYFQAIGQVLSRAGVPDAFTSYRNATASDAEKMAATQIAMWAYLDKMPMSSTMQNKILNNMVGGENMSPSLRDADTLLKNKVANAKFGGELTDEMNGYFDKYNIPADFRPSLRNTIIQMAVASIADDTTGNAQFDAKNIETLLQSNFSNKGTYRYSSALKGVPVDVVDAQIDSAIARTQHGIDTMGMKGKVTAQMNYETGMIQLFVDGSPLVGTGTYSNLSGTGIHPFGIAVAGMKPADMSEQKFNDAQSTLIGTAVLASGLTSIGTNSELQTAARKLAPGMSAADTERMAYKFLNVLADPEIQKEYYAWYNSNYSNTRVISAPKEFRKLMVDTLVSNAVNTSWQAVGTALLSGNVSGGIALARAAESKKIRQDQFGHMVDFLYTRMQDGNTMRVDVGQSVHYESKGFPYFSVDAQVRNCGHGWTITSATEGEHAKNSLHYKGMAVDIGMEGGFWNALDEGRWNRLNPVKFKALWDNFLEPNIKNGNIIRIGTSLPELVGTGAKVGYLRKYASYKNAKGNPVFVNMADHSDHFHVEFANQVYNPGTNKPYGINPQDWALQASENIYANLNSKGGFGYVTREEAKAGALLWYDYEPSVWDLNNTGRSYNELTANPVLRAQTALAKMTRAKNAMGSANLAIAGMYGARFRLQPLNSNLKAPEETFTIEEVIDMASKDISTDEYRWMLADMRNANKYNKVVDRFIKAGK